MNFPRRKKQEKYHIFEALLVRKRNCVRNNYKSGKRRKNREQWNMLDNLRKMIILNKSCLFIASLYKNIV